MSVGKGVAAALGVLLLVIGLFTRHWWSANLSFFQINVGLFSVEACFDTICQSSSLGEITGGKSAVAWGMCRTLLVLFAIGQVLVSVACGWSALTGQHIGFASRVNAIVSGGAFFMGLGTMFLFPGGNEVSLGWSPLCLMSGVVLLLFTNVAFILPPREHAFVTPIVIVTDKADHTAKTAPPKTPEAIVAAAKKEKKDGSETLRHVVKSATVTAAGLTVVEPSGAKLAVSFADIVEIVARRLPPDPPYLGALFVDFVTRERPLRMTAKTQASYAALPGGAATSAQENMRKLALYATLQNPSVRIEGESEAFVRKGTAAPLLQTARDLEAFDARY